MEHDLVPSNLAKVMLGEREKTNKALPSCGQTG